jgi:hypothetical protein
MNSNELVLAGNQHRANHDPEQALSCYAQAFAQDRHNPHAFNNYGNVLRECGDPAGAVPFLQRATQLDPTNTTAQFNLSVAYLLMGDYARGWPQYETRWNFEHMAGTLPKYSQPRWTGQDLEGKTIFVVSEQGLGDNIQFVRFLEVLLNKKAQIILSVNNNLAPLFEKSSSRIQIVLTDQTPEQFDYWTPIMSIPSAINLTLDTLPRNLVYLKADPEKVEHWRQQLGPKHRLRVGFCYSGRKDNWLNAHKGMNVDTMLDLVKRNPNYDWINLQMDADAEDLEKMRNLNCSIYNDQINNFADTAGLVHHLDVVISVDTAAAHLAGAMGRPTWIPLNWFGTDWRWLLDRDSSPWYPSARLFRQPTMGDWSSVIDKIHQYLSWFKI